MITLPGFDMHPIVSDLRRFHHFIVADLSRKAKAVAYDIPKW